MSRGQSELVGMSRRVVITTHGVMCDIRYPLQEKALRLAQGGGYIRRTSSARPRGERSWAVDFIGDRLSLRC